MRTTVNIDDGLLETAKQRAREEHKTLGEVLVEALQRLFAAGVASDDEVPPLPVFDGGGPMPGVDLTTNAGLYAAMYDEEDARLSAEFRRARP